MRIIAIAVVVITAPGCMTLYGGATQRVRVVSTPPDAQVFLDGQPVGVTPVDVTVSRRNPRPVISIEKDGYPTYRRRPQRSDSVGRILGSVGIGAGLGFVAAIAIIGGREIDDPGMAGWAIGAMSPVIDYRSGALFKFPDRIDARLARRAPGWLQEPERRRRERDRWLREPAGLRESLSRSLARGAQR